MIDLHMHSAYSDDGEKSPTELVRRCAARGIAVMSVTDHNCVRANAEAGAAARKLGISYVTGIEVDCTCQNSDFHLLGYGIDEAGADFEQIEQNIRLHSREASLERWNKTRELGFLISEDELHERVKDRYWSETWTGELFAELLLQKAEYAGHPLLRPYRPGGARGDNPYVNFYWDFYSQGKPCAVRIQYPEMARVIEIIHRNHGVAVLAHPGVNLKGKEYLLEGMVGLRLDGIEAFSSYHTPDQCAAFYREGKARGLFVTCGSDFHGKTKPAICLGGHKSLLTDEQLLQQLPRL